MKGEGRGKAVFAFFAAWCGRRLRRTFLGTEMTPHGATGMLPEGVRSEKGPGRALPYRGREEVTKKGRKRVAPFWEPDTRQQPLPLLPFGPGGVGGATAVRFPELIKRKTV